MNDIDRARQHRADRRKLATATFEATTYDANLFVVSWEGAQFKIASTQDGLVDLATPVSGTYPLSPDEAITMAKALISAVNDARRGQGGT